MHMDRVRQALDRVDAVNVAMAERAERRAADGTEFAERADFARQRAEAGRAAAAHSPPASPSSAPARDWRAERRWINGIISDFLKPILREIGAVAGRTDRRLDALDARMTSDGTATVALIV